MSQITERLSDFLGERAGRLQSSLGSSIRDSRMSVVVGRLLGAAFVVCFLTGLYSHFLQQPLPWMQFPTRPVNLYQWTQGIHVSVGIAIIPLMLAKLWVVYPKLFTWPPVTSFVSFIERLSIAVLVSSALLEPIIGLLNTYQWYPWPFSFRRAHFGLAWVIIGSLAVHIAVKLPMIVQYWRRGSDDDEREPDAVPGGAGDHDSEEVRSDG